MVVGMMLISERMVAIRKWRFAFDLARELRNYDCIVAYDIFNEPCPEKGTGLQEETELGEAQAPGYCGWPNKLDDDNGPLFHPYV
jgi:hypothetical protein